MKNVNPLRVCINAARRALTEGELRLRYFERFRDTATEDEYRRMTALLEERGHVKLVSNVLSEHGLPPFYPDGNVEIRLFYLRPEQLELWVDFYKNSRLRPGTVPHREARALKPADGEEKRKMEDRLLRIFAYAEEGRGSREIAALVDLAHYSVGDHIKRWKEIPTDVLDDVFDPKNGPTTLTDMRRVVKRRMEEDPVERILKEKLHYMALMRGFKEVEKDGEVHYVP